MNEWARSQCFDNQDMLTRLKGKLGWCKGNAFFFLSATLCAAETLGKKEAVNIPLVISDSIQYAYVMKISVFS